MKKVKITILALAIALASCTGGSDKTVTTTDSTQVKTDTTLVKTDSCVKVDTTKCKEVKVKK